MIGKIFRINIIAIASLLFFIFSSCFAEDLAIKQKINDSQNIAHSSIIGILVPLQHKALDEIVLGFEQEISKKYQGKVNFVVKNAQGDINIQRSILQQFAHDQVDLVVVIGTASLEMALNVIKEKPVLGLAANFTENDRKNIANKNVSNIVDEIPIQKQLQFAAKIIPNLRKAVLVYSSTEKSMKDADDFFNAAKNAGIVVQKLMIQQLSELYTVAQQIDRENQAIFIEKDHLVVSGISTLSQTANKLQIPLISADDGSVQDGAAFAVGVFEKQIGVEGAKLALQFLAGAKISKLPIAAVNKVYVFVNPVKAKQQGITANIIEQAAKQAGYEIVSVGGFRGNSR